MILSSLAGAPHHFSLRTSVTVWAVWSMAWSRKGPALVGNRPAQAVSKAAGVRLVLAGYSGAYRDRQSAKGLAKVTTASRSLAPGTTEAIWSYPVLLAMSYLGSVPPSAFHCAAKSASVMGVPSDHTAFGLIRYVTTWWPPVVDRSAPASRFGFGCGTPCALA